LCWGVVVKECIKYEVQGLRSLKNRSLLNVNEDFEGKHNAEIYILVILFLFE
jgi:hypothetical protein